MKKGLRKNKKGFTLIELIIVIAILAILAAVAIPSFVGLQAEAERGRNIGNATAIVTAINAYNAIYPDAICDSTADADLQLVKNKDLWPKGMTNESEALGYVSVASDGLATVINTAAASSSSPAES